jgi:hypothetical protein
MLPLGEALQRRHQDVDVVFLLPPDDRRGVLARRREVDAVLRTLNLREALGAAADRADRLPECGTGTPLLPYMA